MIDELGRRRYDSDPIKTWKKSQTVTAEEAAEDEDVDRAPGEEEG